MVQEQEDSVGSLLSICCLCVRLVMVDHIDHHHYLWYLILVNLGQVFKVVDDLVDYDQEVVDRCFLLDLYSLGC